MLYALVYMGRRLGGFRAGWDIVKRKLLTLPGIEL
jgi:hypothetical protein